MVEENHLPVVEVQMLIRKPVSEVFQAFIDPEITTRFWFTRSTGKLEPGKNLTWFWDMYGVSGNVLVKEIDQDELISLEWGDPATSVDFEFMEVSGETTYVIIKHYGFDLEGLELIQAIKDSTGGFTTVLDGLKVWLEHGIQLNLVADKFPAEVTGQGK
jgi:uncharacterized protein YndB with AHSA1/START domain